MKSLIKKFGKINSSVLALCLLFLILEVIGHRHGETSIEDIMFFPAFFIMLFCIFFSGRIRSFRLGVQQCPKVKQIGTGVFLSPVQNSRFSSPKGRIRYLNFFFSAQMFASNGSLTRDSIGFSGSNEMQGTMILSFYFHFFCISPGAMVFILDGNS